MRRHSSITPIPLTSLRRHIMTKKMPHGRRRQKRPVWVCSGGDIPREAVVARIRPDESAGGVASATHASVRPAMCPNLLSDAPFEPGRGARSDSPKDSDKQLYRFLVEM